MSGLRNQILVGDATEQLSKLSDASVDMVLTSPPYFRLRDYDHPGQLGLENSVDEWVLALRGIARQVQRVLVPTGTFWLNVSDTYANHPRQGAAPKSLLLAPERLALVMLEDGWLLRNKVVWQKANPMPSSVRDRLTCSWEALYVFTKQPSYFFDLDAIRQPHTSRHHGRIDPQHIRPRERESWRGPNGDDASGLDALKARGIIGHPLGKNPGDVWRIASSNYRGAHHATFPVALAERAILAGSPEARCTRCRSPWTRQLIRAVDGAATRSCLRPSCKCAVASEQAVVLDPFFGAGTTAVAAEQLKRDWLGIELNPDFAELAETRIRQARASPISKAA
ncbi:MAG: site-specific DNA-methyltransferase [Actinomycetota bacterium]|nr:site-specific DNA-methyltransferase [Actinomycetota bacterium]